jgi:hypothetical protein
VWFKWQAQSPEFKPQYCQEGREGGKDRERIKEEKERERERERKERKKV